MIGAGALPLYSPAWSRLRGGKARTGKWAAAGRAAVENSADLIEPGIPFSDPTAEGAVIQKTNLRALKDKITTDRMFGVVRELRRDIRVPMTFMTYANAVFSCGAERFSAPPAGTWK